MSVVEMATLRALEGREAQLESAIPEGLDVIREDEGCLGATAYRCVERPREFVLAIIWASVEAHEAFRAGDGLPRYRAKLAGGLDEVIGFAHFAELGPR
jgi:quinol monooxygenase YgiN